jgi:hypothetical protein
MINHEKNISFFELFEELLTVADAAFLESWLGTGLFWGEYMDGTPAPPGITEIEIEQNPHYLDLCGYGTIGIQVVAPLQDCRVFLEWNPQKAQFEQVLWAMTLEGQCTPGCTCHDSYCPVYPK